MSRRPVIYLAGPIMGTTFGESNDWRNDMTDRLKPHGITCVSPLRCEAIIGDRYGSDSQDPCFGTHKAIVSKNFLDVQNCDMALVYMPKPPGVDELAAIIGRMDHVGEVLKDAFGELDVEQDEAIRQDAATLKRLSALSPQRSIGTIGELSWCYALQKPVVVVSNDPIVQLHPFFGQQAGWMLETLDDAERLIVGLWKDYVG